MMTKSNCRKSILDDYDRIPISAPEYPDVLQFVSVPRKCVYDNISASSGAKIIKLAFSDRELFK